MHTPFYPHYLVLANTLCIPDDCHLTKATPPKIVDLTAFPCMCMLSSGTFAYVRLRIAPPNHTRVLRKKQERGPLEVTSFMPGNTELSEREREILGLVATGASNKEIAQKLSISTNTVKVHLRNIFAKAGVVSRTEATLYAIRQGVVQVEGSKQGEVAPTGVQAPEALPVLKAREAARFRQSRWWLLVVPIVLLVSTASMLFVTRQPSTTASASPALPATVSRWQAKAALPTARQNLAAAIYENEIYAIGGETELGVSSLAERYSLKDDTWTTLPAKPVAVTEASAAVIRGKIYVPGGRLASGQVTDILEAYDPRQNQWEQLSPLPTGLCAYAFVAFEGKLYVFGGWNGKQVLSSVYAYDPEQDTWYSRAPMPTAREYSGAAISGGKIYVMGGYNGKQVLSANEEYVPERDNGTENPWNMRAPLPNARHSMGVASVAGIVHLVGGMGDGKDVLPPLDYFAQLDKWQPFESPLGHQWSNLALVPTDTHIYALGGRLEGALTVQNLSYQAIYTIIIPALR